MTLIEVIGFLLLAGIGLRWTSLVLPSWFASVGWIAAAGAGWMGVAWGLLVFPLLLLLVSRRNRIDARDDVNGHLKNVPREGSEVLARYRGPMSSGGGGGGSFGGGGGGGSFGVGGGSFGGGGASGGW